MFSNIIDTSQELKLEVTTLFKASNDIENDLVHITNKGNYDLLLIMRENLYMKERCLENCWVLRPKSLILRNY